MSSSSSAAPAAAAPIAATSATYSTSAAPTGAAPTATAPTPSPRSPRGADRLVEALIAEGVTTVFGLPGGASLPIHDALIASSIDHVLVRHEAAAGHAAEGYAKATGRVGVALVTSGPGATNLVTAIADAHADSVPTVFLTAQVPTTLRGTDAFQECDVLSMTAPIVKHAIGVEAADDVADAIHEAFHVARTGRPGPVVVDVPSDLAKAPARGPRTSREDAGAGTVALPGYRLRATPNGAQVRRAAAAIAAAERPVVLAGGGVVHADAAAELTALVRDFGLPVTTTLMALGAVPSDDPAHLGMPGMYGAPTANAALQAADLIVAVGARFDDRVTGDLDAFATRARVVHVDVDAAELGKNVAAHVPVVGDAGLALAAIGARLHELTSDAAGRDAWHARLDPWRARIDGWRAAHATPPPVHADDAISAEATLDRLAALTGGEALVTTDVGQHQMWAATRLRFAAPRRWLTSGGLGTMGFGLPAAIGAAVALAEGGLTTGASASEHDEGVGEGEASAAESRVPEHPPTTGSSRPVVCVTGDGSLLMNLQELATAAELGVPVKVLLFDNASLGMVREQQDTHYAGRRAASMLPGLDWESLGRGFGVRARSVDDPAEVDAALEELLAADGPALLRVGLPVEQGCVPAFRAGGAMPLG